MFFRWKGCSSKCVGLLVIFVIMDLIVIWAIILSKQRPSKFGISFQGSSSSSSSASHPEFQALRRHQQQTPTRQKVQLKQFINYANLQGGLGELEFKVWLNRESWKQDNPELVDAVKKVFLIPPSKDPYKLSISNAIKINPSDGQIQAVEKLLKKLSPGFFIECGANDGELDSNTIWLEKELGWTGLLVEADPYPFQKLKNKNRKAWLANVCLAGYKFPRRVTFYRNPVTSEAGGLIYDPSYGAIIPTGAQCIPLYTMLLALNRTTVDFFSLDVEGNELQVLKTIPFESVTFKVITVDHRFVEEGKRALWRFMKSKGYIMYKTIRTKVTGDTIFIHPSMAPLLKEVNSGSGSNNNNNNSNNHTKHKMKSEPQKIESEPKKHEKHVPSSTNNKSSMMIFPDQSKNNMPSDKIII